VLPFFCPTLTFSPTTSLLQSFLSILADTITLRLIKPLAEKFLAVQKAALQFKAQINCEKQTHLCSDETS